MMNEKWNDNLVQFARLLCEVVAIQEDLDIAGLAESMDLTQEDVLVLLDRANTEWERAKGNVPEQGGWFCDHCSKYFSEELDQCPTCGAFVDVAAGFAHRDEPEFVGGLTAAEDEARMRQEVIEHRFAQRDEGQDRESYTDDQDRESYTVDEDEEQEFDVSIRNTFTATDPQHAVRQMVEYLTAYLANAEYKVERFNEGESEAAQSWWISAS